MQWASAINCFDFFPKKELLLGAVQFIMSDEIQSDKELEMENRRFK